MEEEIEITTTHLYIRFKPKNEEELTLLEKDTTLLLFDHPLDYEITEEGDFYQDPEIPEEQPTYQYTYVEWDKALPNVSYEIVSEFIPTLRRKRGGRRRRRRGCHAFKKPRRYPCQNMAGLLEEEALKITNNLEEEEKNSISEKCWFLPSFQMEAQREDYALGYQCRKLYRSRRSKSTRWKMVQMAEGIYQQQRRICV